MKPISDDSLAKRLAFVKRRFKNRSNWDLFPLDSEQQLLRRQEQAHYSLLIFFGFFLAQFGINKILDGLFPLDWKFFVAVAICIYFFYLCYSLVRLRWALEAFEHFGPQSIADLEIEIAEQGEDTKPENAPS